MGSHPSAYQFGVEIELLIGTRKKSFSSWKAVAQDVSKWLLHAGISNHINEGSSTSCETYQEWSIAQEVTIPSQPGKNLWGIELVSPIYPANWCWAADLDTIFTAIESTYTITESSSCSTHVHISCTPTALSAAELALMAKAALYFGPALDSIVPAARKSSSAYWCQSNRDSQALKGYSLDQCFKLLDRATATTAAGRDLSLSAAPSSASVLAVVQAMNLFPVGSAYGRAHGKRHDFIRGKAFKWDFSGMLPKSIGGGAGLGTIEFRQPPGSLCAEEACAWITLALSLVAGVTTAGSFDTVNMDEGASATELWTLLQTGAAYLGWNGVGSLEMLFTGSSSDDSE